MLIELNQEIVNRLSKTELSIVNFINENEKSLPDMSIVDIGEQTFSSPATVSRAIRKCDVMGFNELRYRCASIHKKGEAIQVADIINQSLSEVQAITEGVKISQILYFVEEIKKGNKIYVFARGLTEFVAEEFSLRLQLLGYNTTFIRDPNIMRVITKKMNKQDMLILFSLNGETPELIESAQNASWAKAKVGICCCNNRSELIKYADFSLLGFSDENTGIREYEVYSRLPLFVLSRIITEFLAIS